MTATAERLATGATSCAPAAAPRQVPFAAAFRFWLKLGFISFGGPAGQIAIMHRELVERRRWIGEQRFLHALNYCMLLPGPEAQQLAIYIGWLLHRVPGGLVAGALFVLPSVAILLALSFVYAAFGHMPLVAALFAGVKPVVVAIVVEAVMRIGRRALRRGWHIAIAAAAFVAIYLLHVSFPLIVLGAAAAGLALGRPRRVRPDAPGTVGELATPGAVVAPAAASEPFVIGDEAPSPPHALPSRGRAFRTLAAGVILWLAPFALLAAARGRQDLLAQEYLFFTRAALVTFGGAYSVLAYVTQAAVESYGWITHAQAIDGLALAESTPGPLIMVLQFIGFMAGWNHPGAGPQATEAVLSAFVTTWTTFLPCFVFIFLGAPWIEVLRGHQGLAGALSGVTAAVVGIILNLALVFGAAVIVPRGLAGGVAWFPAAVAALAFAILHRFGPNVLWAVLAGALAGLARALLFG
ncbi:MAG TPA: chromate efflux transporter [Candidatus Cryosericum sp.]|nr:chromate efflux transporter [Candidatus Cryosericum sp.]